MFQVQAHVAQPNLVAVLPVHLSLHSGGKSSRTGSAEWGARFPSLWHVSTTTLAGAWTCQKLSQHRVAARARPTESFRESPGRLKELEDRLQESQQQRQELATEVAKLRAQLERSSASTQDKALPAAAGKAPAVAGREKEAVKELQLRAERAEAELQRLQDEVAGAARAAAEQSKAHEDAAAKIRALVEEREKEANLRMELQLRVEKAEAELQRLRREVQAAGEATQRAADKAKEQVESVKVSMEQQRRIQLAKAQVDAAEELKAVKDVLCARAEAAESEAQRLRVTLDMKAEELRMAEAAKTALLTRAEAAEAVVSELQRRVEELEAEREAAKHAEEMAKEKTTSITDASEEGESDERASEVEALKQAIREKKSALASTGLSQSQVNQDKEVLQLVSRLKELKQKTEVVESSSHSSTQGKVSVEERDQMAQQIREELADIKQVLMEEADYTEEEAAETEEVQIRETQLRLLADKSSESWHIVRFQRVDSRLKTKKQTLTEWYHTKKDRREGRLAYQAWDNNNQGKDRKRAEDTKRRWIEQMRKEKKQRRKSITRAPVAVSGFAT